MNRPRPLARVLLRRIAVWYLLFAVAVTGTQLYIEYRNIRQDVVQTLDALARTFTPGVAAALWDYQEDLLKSLARGIGEHTLVVAVDISDLHGRINAHYRTTPDETVAENLTVQQPLYHRFEDGQQEALGTLRIASSTSRVLAQLRSVALSAGLFIAAQLLFLGVALALLARLLVVEPLTRFSEQVSHLKTGEEQQIDLGATPISEIATLQQGFNQLLQRVAESHQAITTTNASLERRIAERTRNLDERNRELRREHELTLALVRSIPGFVCVISSNGAILLANAAANRLLGSPGVALVGQNWALLPTLAAPDHPLHDLMHQVQAYGQGNAQATFTATTGPAQTYQFEALRIGQGSDARIIMVGVDISAQQEQKLLLQHLAFHDRLTGLPNRALLLEHLDNTLRSTRYQQQPFALAFIDLDQFKPINDSAGHEAGDAVLQEIASRLRQCVREQDLVSRHGGDEFVLLLHSPAQGLPRIAYAILEAITQPIHWQGARFQVSASIGFALFPRDGTSPQQLLDAADAAMYRAKQAGRNRADFGSAPLLAAQ